MTKLKGNGFMLEFKRFKNAELCEELFKLTRK